MLLHGKIVIANISGDIEITATKNIGTYIVKGGKLIRENYQLFGTSSSRLEQKDGFVEWVGGAAVEKACGISWKVVSDGKNFSKLICRLSNPKRSTSGAGGGFIFGGTTSATTSTSYADGNYAWILIGANEFATFSTPKEYRSAFSCNSSSFFVGIQLYWRGAYAYTRTFNIYDLILVE